VNVLRNDAESALAIAACTSAACIRVNVHVGARVTDQGIVQGRAAETLRSRQALGAESVAIWADVDVKHSAPLGERPLEDEVADAVERGLADAILVTGKGTGHAVDLAALRAAKRIARVPVLAASGVTHESVRAVLAECDGVIVGSALRHGGKAGGPVDAKLAADFVRAAGR
jgi:membrane complex biogenesis BtpA family protein